VLWGLSLLVGTTLFCALVGSLGLDTIARNLNRLGWWFVLIVALWGLVYALNACAFGLILGSARARVGAAALSAQPANSKAGSWVARAHVWGRDESSV
jgi:hypothetical protein